MYVSCEVISARSSTIRNVNEPVNSFAHILSNFFPML